MPYRWAYCLPVLLTLACNSRESTTIQGRIDGNIEPRAYDWPQWRGPERTGVSKETGLLGNWPTGGPKLVWKNTSLGAGYSTPSIARGHIFGLSFRGKDEVVWVLDEATGKEIWSQRLAKAQHTKASQGNEGSHSTPTVDGDAVYVEGIQGDIACLNLRDGEIRWQKSLVGDFGGDVPIWGYSESPLVDGDQVIFTPGGNTATLVALDKKSGATVWKSAVPGGNTAAYSSPVVAEIDGQRQYVQLLHQGVVGVSAKEGRFLWRYDKPANNVANCTTPIVSGNLVFAASGYGNGGGLARVTRKGDQFQADEVAFSKHMKNHHGGVVLIDGYYYGADDPGSLACLDAKTLQVMWEERKPGKGSISAADGRLYYRNEAGPIVLVDASRKGYVERGRLDQPDRTRQSAWPHPVIANGKLYIRDQNVLLCYDVKDHAQTAESKDHGATQQESKQRK